MADKKVLIIESDPKFTKVLPLFFRDSGFGVSIAQNGDEGVQLARSDVPTVILLNLEMDNQKAYDVASKLKGDAATRRIPIIVMAEKRSEEEVQGDDRITGKWQGYIRKPFVKRSILQKIDEVLAVGANGGGDGENAEEELDISLDDMFAGSADEKPEAAAAPAAAAPVAAARPEPEPEPAPAIQEPEPPARPGPAPAGAAFEAGGDARVAYKNLEREMLRWKRESERLEKELKRKEEESARRVATAQEESRRLEDELKKKAELISQLSTNLKTLNEESSAKEMQLREDGKKTKADRDRLETRVAEVGQKLETRSQEVEDLTRNLQETEKQLSETEKQREATSGELSRTKESLAATEKRLALAERELTAKIADLEGQVQALREKVRTARDAIQKGLENLG